MRDLSLHILDLIENSIRAGASEVCLTVEEDFADNRMTIVVEDNGPGIDVPADTATDPFYTTKRGKKTGLGLSLFRAAAERAGGRLDLRQSSLGGLAVEATMELNHIDRSPLGDIAGTVSSLVCTNPDLDLRCHLRVGQQTRQVSVPDVSGEMDNGSRCGLAVARQVSQKIREALEGLQIRT
jgi:hypothetical protein